MINRLNTIKYIIQSIAYSSQQQTQPPTLAMFSCFKRQFSKSSSPETSPLPTVETPARRRGLKNVFKKAFKKAYDTVQCIGYAFTNPITFLKGLINSRIFHRVVYSPGMVAVGACMCAGVLTASGGTLLVLLGVIIIVGGLWWAYKVWFDKTTFDDSTDILNPRNYV